jgi:hypothetical protein
MPAFLMCVCVCVCVCVRARACQADHSPPSSTELKNERSYSSAPPYAFMACTGITLPLHLRYQKELTQDLEI